MKIMLTAILLFGCCVCAFSSIQLATYMTPRCGTEDDTSAVQAAIDSGQPVLLPAGQVRISSLNMTNRRGAVLTGCGNYVTTIIPTQSGVNVIDLTGSSNTTLSNFHIAGTNEIGIEPLTGILCAQAAGSYTSDVVMIDHVRVDGYFAIAAFYNLGVVSSSVSSSQFYNYRSNSITVIFTGNNFFGAESRFTAINQDNNYMPSDWTFTQVELHNFGQQAAFWIGGATSIRFFGGNISSSAIPISNNSVYTGSGSIAFPRFIVFEGTTFYSDFRPIAPRAIADNAGGGIAVRDCDSGFPIF